MLGVGVTRTDIRMSFLKVPLHNLNTSGLLSSSYRGPARQFILCFRFHGFILALCMGAETDRASLNLLP